MMLWKANTWPQGVIWGHKGLVSKEMGHCTSPPVIITTCHKWAHEKVKSLLAAVLACLAWLTMGAGLL